MGLLQISELGSLGDNGLYPVAAAPMAPTPLATGGGYATQYLMPGARPPTQALPPVPYRIPATTRERSHAEAALSEAKRRQEEALRRQSAERARRAELTRARNASEAARRSVARSRKAAWEARVKAYKERLRLQAAQDARQRAKDEAALRGKYGASAQRVMQRLVEERKWRLTRPKWSWTDPRYRKIPGYVWRQTPEYKEALKQRLMYLKSGSEGSPARKYGEGLFLTPVGVELTKSQGYLKAQPGKYVSPNPYSPDIPVRIQPFIYKLF